MDKGNVFSLYSALIVNMPLISPSKLPASIYWGVFCTAWISSFPDSSTLSVFSSLVEGWLSETLVFPEASFTSSEELFASRDSSVAVSFFSITFVVSLCVSLWLADASSVSASIGLDIVLTSVSFAVSA